MLLWLGAAALAVILLILPGLIALDDIQARIAGSLSDALHRTVTIRHVHLAFYPWLGLRARGITIANARGFAKTPLARIARARIEVRVLPLFARHLVLRRVIVTGLRLRLSENARGATNWATLLAPIHPPPPKTRAARIEAREAPFLAFWRAAGFTLKGARIRYQNARTHTHLMLTHLRLRTGPLVPGRAVTLAAAGALGVGARPPIPFRGRLTWQRRGRRDLVRPFALRIATLKVLGALTAERTAAGFTARGTLRAPPFAPRPLLAALGLHYTPRDPRVLKTTSARLGFAWRRGQLRISPLRATLDGTTITGHVRIISHPRAYQATLTLNHIAPRRYLPFPSPKKAPHPAARAGAVPAAHAPAYPPATLALAIGRLRLKGLILTHVRMGLSTAGHSVRLRPFSASLAHGTLAGDALVAGAGAHAAWRLHAQLAHVHIGALLRAWHHPPLLSGPLSGSAALTGRGLTRTAIERSLGGRLGIRVPKGTLLGLDLDLIAKDPKAAAGTHTAKTTEGTAFSGLRADATFLHGRGYMPRLSLRAARAAVAGHGTFGLASRRLDYLLHVTLPSGLSIPVRVRGAMGHVRFHVALAKLFSGHQGSQTLKTLRRRLQGLFGLR